MRRERTPHVLFVGRTHAHESVLRGLRAIPCTIDETKTGEQALSSAGTRVPDIVVAVLDLPTMSGWELAESLRDKCGARLRLIAMTTRGTHVDYRRSVMAGFDAHLVEPVAAELVLDTIRSLLPVPH